MLLGISCESSARQLLHMNAKLHFLWKIKNKNKKMSSAAFVIRTFKVNIYGILGPDWA